MEESCIGQLYHWEHLRESFHRSKASVTFFLQVLSDIRKAQHVEGFPRKGY
jgi:hypothetical protein